MDDPHLLPKDGFGRQINGDKDEERCTECHVKLVAPGPRLPARKQGGHRHAIENELRSCVDILSFIDTEGCAVHRVQTRRTI